MTDVHASLPGLIPTATQQTVPIVEQQQLARDTYRIRFWAPALAKQICPGQFLMIREPHQTDPLLGRPFALYDTWLDEQGEPAGLDIVYLVIGKMTNRMRNWKAGDLAEIWGPLGNGFPVPSAGRLILVAGGIGQTPFLGVAREALGKRAYGSPARAFESGPSKLLLCYGVRNQEYLAGLDDFASVGLDVRISTDDGSAGRQWFVTDLLREELATGDAATTTVYCCGPEPMMHAVAQVTAEAGVACYLSLETPMACGFGACFSCVTRVRQADGDWDYRRVCVEGPVFRADCLALS